MTNSLFNAVVQLHDAHCEHVRVGERAYRRDIASDGLGNVECWAGCEECAKAVDEAVGAAMDVCSDCGQEFPMRELMPWSYWDDTREDEPLLLCPHCGQAEKHIERVRQDRASLERELKEQEDWDV